MKRLTSLIFATIVFAIFVAVSLYNRIQTNDENITVAWSEVIAQFQSRADLITHVVSTVKSFSQDENDVLTSVIEAHTKVAKIQVSTETLNNPEIFQQFTQAQGQLGSVLNHLFVTVERDPKFKSNANFLALQAQLEQAENRITVAKKRYIDRVRDYNLTVQRFPGKLFDYDTKPNFAIANESATEPPAITDSIK
ncbi:MAG: LemA family protein [Thiotrichaceae bacterium]|nr:LemA family protein [Thiotrichaceae bacterium]